MRLAVTLCAAACGWAAGFSDQFEHFKRAATPAEMYRFLWALPKGGDIHMHMGLSFWASDWYDAVKDRFYTRVRVSGCREEQAPVLYANVTRETWESMTPCEKGEYVAVRDAPRQDWISSLIVDRPGEGRDEFFERIVGRATPLIRDTASFGEVFRRSAARWKAENIRYIELMGQPRNVDELPRFKQWAREAPLAVRYLGIFVRFAEDAETRLAQVAAQVHANRDFWVGINMAGREDNDKGYPLRFLEPFREMRRRYPRIPLTLHAGEVDSPGTQVRDTLKLGATRIGHAVNLISDPDTMLLMRQGRILIEANLISNRLLGYTPDLKRHPFLEYLRFGIPICLNTDDQGSWDSSLTDEYFEAIRAFDLTWEEVVALGRASLEHSFAEPSLKQKLLADYDAAVAAFETSETWRHATPIVSGYARRNFFAGRNPY